MDQPDSFDLSNMTFEDFQREDEDKQKEKTVTLSSKFKKERDEWSEKIRVMSQKIKNIDEISSLMTSIYTDRQLAVEYYHYIISLSVRINRSYRQQYAQKYDHYSFKSQHRFPNETTKNNKILSEMSTIVTNKEELKNHSDFMSNTIKTLDNIIFGIKYRIEVEQINRGR